MTGIDVLLPFHRDDELLRLAIESVLASRGPRLTLLLIDDRKDQINQLRNVPRDSRVNLIRTHGGVGYGHAIRNGIENSEAPVVALMNSDDLIHPQRFQKQITKLGHSDVCISKIQKISMSDREVPSITGSLESLVYSPFFLLFGAYGADATWMCERSWLKENWIPDRYPALDWRLALTCFTKSRIEFLPEPLYFYRRHGVQTSAKKLQSSDFHRVYSVWLDLQSPELQALSSFQIFKVIAAPWDNTSITDFAPLRDWIFQLVDELAGQEEEILRQVHAFLARRVKLVLIRQPWLLFKNLDLFASSVKNDASSVLIDYLRYSSYR